MFQLIEVVVCINHVIVDGFNNGPSLTALKSNNASIIIDKRLDFVIQRVFLNFIRKTQELCCDIFVV